MANLGVKSNSLSNGGPAGGMGSNKVNEDAPYILERPTFWKNPHEANAHNMARGGSSKGRSNANEVGGR
jgi:hypothetical protein